MKRIGELLQGYREFTAKIITLKRGQAKTAIRIGYALLWRRLDMTRIGFADWIIGHRMLVRVLVLLLFIRGSIYISPKLSSILGPYFETNEQLERLNSLFLTLGGALIGAAAIVFALVIFILQVNFERMPHGLFRKLSSDWRLLCAFVITFVSGIAVCTLSLLPEKSSLAFRVLAALGLTGLILCLFLYAFRRASP